MSRAYLVLAACLTLVGCGKSSANLPLVVDTDSFEAQVLLADKPVLVDFWGEACPQCKEFEPVVDQLSEEYRGRLKVVQIDVAKAENVVKDYSIETLPTFIVFHYGKEVGRQVGVREEMGHSDQLHELITTTVPSLK